MITVSLPPVVDRAEIEALIRGRARARFADWDFLSPPRGAAAADIDVVVSPFHTSSATPNPSYVGIPDLAAALPQAHSARTRDDGVVVHPVERLVEVVRGADALVCTVPLTPATHGLIGPEVLGALADGAAVVNVGRGPVVQTEAMLAQLRTGRLTAALDVTDPEPLPDGHELWSLPNAVITPHVGGNTRVMPILLHRLVAEQIVRVATGQEPANIVFRPPTDPSPSALDEESAPHNAPKEISA